MYKIIVHIYIYIQNLLLYRKDVCDSIASIVNETICLIERNLTENKDIKEFRKPYKWQNS